MDPRRRRPPPLRGPRKLGALKFWTVGTRIIKWIDGPSQVLSQQMKINLFCSSVTVNLDQPAIGSHLVNQTDPRGKQNDPVDQERRQSLKTNSQHTNTASSFLKSDAAVPLLAILKTILKI